MTMSRAAVPMAVLLLALAVAGPRMVDAARGDTTAALAALPTPSCPQSQSSTGADYHGATLTRCNFSGADLRKANFRNATLTAVVFVRADLTDADFTDATFVDSGSASLPTDFSFAILSNAVFDGARFHGPTYFSYATLHCADFSQTDLNTGGNAIFGDEAIVLTDPNQPPGDCRAKFRGTTMNCEFVAQWNLLDLTGANVSACARELTTNDGGPGHDFSGGLYGSVVFDNLVLSRSKWSGAVLENASFQGATLDGATGLTGTTAQPSRLSAAKFNGASARNVDFSNAQLYGANFTNANLDGASFVDSFLTSNTRADPPVISAARFDGAFLRNATFAGAKLASASFRYASLYTSPPGIGSSPTLPCAAASSCGMTGFTCGCASASGADLTSANFDNAYLYGVDFSGAGTTVNGTQFGAAILTAASFSGVQFKVNDGAAPDFSDAMLQGTVFAADANLGQTSFSGAFVDLGAPGNDSTGNTLYLQLGSQYTQFRGWQGASTPCVAAIYDTFTVVPAESSMTCPDGTSAICGDGTSETSLAHWRNGTPGTTKRTTIDQATPPGWYGTDSTYDAAPSDPSVICGNGGTTDPNW